MHSPPPPSNNVIVKEHQAHVLLIHCCRGGGSIDHQGCHFELCTALAGSGFGRQYSHMYEALPMWCDPNGVEVCLTVPLCGGVEESVYRRGLAGAGGGEPRTVHGGPPHLGIEVWSAMDGQIGGARGTGKETVL